MKVLKTIGFWLAQCTWGFVMTFIGAIVTLVSMICGNKPHRIGSVIYTQIGYGWGGLELGGFFICAKDASDHTKFHECGHAIQNIIFGPLYPILIWFPSAIRYWLRKFDTRLGKSLFNLFYLLISLIITTGLACLTALVFHIRWLTIIFEVFRIYFLIVSLWLSGFEIKRYDKGYVPYDKIWFEGQASKLGKKFFK